MMSVGQSITDLPTRGFFLSPVRGAVILRPGPSSYIADHSTSPPESQVLKTDSTNILVRSFKNKDPRHSATKKAMKRTAEERQDCQPSTSRQRAAGGEAGPSRSRADNELSQSNLQHMTVAELTDMLRARNLRVSGKKEDLIKRLIDSS